MIELQQIGMPTDVQRLLTDLLDQRASPEATARQLMLRLADAVRLSADLLAFGQTRHAA